MAAESAGRRFSRASPATWAAVFGGLLAVSTVATLPLTLAVAAAGAIAGHRAHVDATGGLSAVDHSAGWYHAVQGPGNLVLVVLAVCFIGRQVLSWRRSSSDRRQQLKWMAGGAAFAVVCAFLATFVGSPGATLLDLVAGLAWFGFAAPAGEHRGGDLALPAV